MKTGHRASIALGCHDTRVPDRIDRGGMGGGCSTQYEG
jgi:hypothetical protein